MSKIYNVKPEVAANALLDKAGFDTMYRRSIDDNEAFWAEQAGIVDWIKPCSKVKDVSFAVDDLHIRWYYDGSLNVCYNCVDRHLESKADDVAIIWEGDDPKRDLSITYGELHKRVCRFANVLKKIGATLVCSVFTEDQAWTQQLLDATQIDRLNIGPVKTNALNWLQPHEGNIVEFLFRARAFQNEPPAAH